MLQLKRGKNSSVKIFDTQSERVIDVQITGIGKNFVKVAFDADRSFDIVRDEVLHDPEKQAAYKLKQAQQEFLAVPETSCSEVQKDVILK